MRIGIDYRFLSEGPYRARRGMGRFTQQQLREVLQVDSLNDYVLCCPSGADTSLIDPEILSAPNTAIRHVPPAITQPSPAHGDDALERAEMFQAWIGDSGFDLFHATTPMLPNEPVMTHLDACPSVVTLYDLIPLVFPDHYLGAGADRDRYLRALALLARAPQLIAISESARHDALHYLGIGPDRIAVAYPVADPVFRPIEAREADVTLKRLRAKLGLAGRFVVSVTHLHHSKNIDLLFGGYALLPARLRRELPLVLCCELDDAGTGRVHAMTSALGIADDVVVTGMVSDEELAALYARAAVVVHPSRYEGFGLPVLEAMRCGTPVITTTSSSLPEVAGGAARLVDPDDRPALAQAIGDVAGDTELRQDLSRRGLAAAHRFSSEQLAVATLDAYRKAVTPPTAGRPADRPRIALWTPVPPQQSGIADYSAELVEELSTTSDIEIFVDSGFTPDLELVRRYPVHHFSAFARRNRSGAFEATIYQMGNSHFHLYMYDAIRTQPGIVVLHDMAWSQVLYGQMRGRGDLAGFISQLKADEGADAAREFVEFERFTPPVCERARLEFLDRHSMLGGLVDSSLAQVVHFDACGTELVEQYPNARPHVVDMGVADPYGRRPHVEQGAARARLLLPSGSFVVGTFGIVHPVKRIEACLRAVACVLPLVPNLVLLVVGRMAGPEYEAHLRHLAAELGVDQHVRFTGHVEKAVLNDHMIATDVVVNLRTPTHKHMSAIVARAVAAAKPVVISEFSGWAFLSESCFVRIPIDDTEVDALAEALKTLADDPRLRERLSHAARLRFLRRGNTRQMAAGYLRVIEAVRQPSRHAEDGVDGAGAPARVLSRTP